MTIENQKVPAQKTSSFEISNWYYIFVLVFSFISLVTLSRNTGGVWEIKLGIDETTPFLIALAILPSLLRLFVGGTNKGTAELLGIGKLSWENIPEIDEELDEKQEKHKRAGDAVKDDKKNLQDIEEIRRDADLDLETKIPLQELPYVQQIYLQKFNELVKEFNRNRHLRSTGRKSVDETDNIAYRMRSIAPLLFGQFDVATWLQSQNMGKQLAAVKYLDWAQDIEYAEILANRLQKLDEVGDTFQSFHILLTLLSMSDQLAYDYREKIIRILEKYTPKGNIDSSRASVKNRILEILL